MPFKVQIGPQQIATHQGQTVLVTEPDGQIAWPSDKGLYFRDTRIVSSWAIYANGQAWLLLNGGATSYYAARIFLTNQCFRTEDGEVPERTLGLTISRSIGGGLHEDLDVANDGLRPVKFQLEIALRCDFADIFEVKQRRIVRRGRIITEWSESDQELRTVYRNRDFSRALSISVGRSSAEAVYANGRLSFEVALDPGGTWHCCLLYALADGAQRLAAPVPCAASDTEPEHAKRTAEWLHTVATISTTNEEFYRLYHQALVDMSALRLPMEGTDHLVFLPAAGLPWFMAPFGRDSLIVSLQNTLVYPGFARGALEILGSLQASTIDDYRDAEPGKIPHEMRYGELAHFKLIPHTPYYGTADATPLYLITMYNAWRATGDRGLVERHLPTAEACLSWIDDYGDRDGDGLQEYQTRSPVGYENLAWKDSEDAVVYPDGSRVKGPKALCELQGYVYRAWLDMAEIFEAFGKPERARRLRLKAAKLFERFNEAFWDEESGFYAFALDGDKKKVLSVASNPGHCLWCGIVPRERAARVVGRLMEPDMWSGWGIRTLSAAHPAFNPYNYQTGSVWPHDNALIALGFKFYGFSCEAARVAHDVSLAASQFMFNQLPELYTALKRRDAFPIQYIGANVPQAWAAGSVFMLVQAMLGFMPDAPHGRLRVDPSLPSWLPEITVQNLSLGGQQLDIRFCRENAGNTRIEVLKGDPRLVERCSIGAEVLRYLPTPATDAGGDRERHRLEPTRANPAEDRDR